MSDPALPLQKEILDRLSNDTGLVAVVNRRVYDTVPAGAVFPYITVGEGQLVGDDNGCGDASEVFARIHSWARDSGYREVKQIAGLVRTSLRSFTPVIAGFAIPVVEFVGSDFMGDPDGITHHAVTEFRYLIDHTT